MADKDTQLSITLKALDHATAPIRALTARINEMTKPARDFKASLSGLGEATGVGHIIDAFKGIGGAITSVVSKVAEVGGVLIGFTGAAAAGLLHLIDKFDDLGKGAARLDVGVDFLAEMRYAAEQTGVPLDALDESLQAFNENLGQARAGTGRMAKFVGMVSPALLKQLKAAKDNAAAFDLLAQAMSKLHDPTERAALAQKTLGDSKLAPLFQQGAAGIAKLRAEYFGLAGSQQGASEQAEKAKGAMVKLHAAFDGVEASLVQGLSPAVTTLAGQITDWLVGHRGDIQKWADKFGKWLPGAVNDAIDSIKKAWKKVAPFFEHLWDDVSAAFHKEWPKIEKIVDMISAAADKVGGVTNTLSAAYDLASGNFAGGITTLVKGGIDRGKEKRAGNGAAGPQSVQDVMDGVEAPMVTSMDRQSGGSLAGFFDDVIGDDAPRARPLTPKLDDIMSTFGLRAPQQAAAPPAPPQRAEIVIHMPKLPPGARVTVDPKSTADVDLNVGYQF